MADEQKEVLIKVTTDTSQAEQGLSKLNSEVDDLNNSDWGAKKVSDLKKELDQADSSAKDLGNSVNNSSNAVSNLGKGASLDGFKSRLQGVVGGVQAFHGAIAAAGIDTQEFEKYMTQAAGLAEFKQGLSDVVEGFGGWVTKIPGIIKGMNGVKLAIASTGIGLLAVAIGLVIANWDKWGDSIVKFLSYAFAPFIAAFKVVRELFTGVSQDARDATAEIAATTKATNDAIKSSQDTIIGAIDKEIAIRKAAGEETYKQEAYKLAVLRKSTKQQLDNFLALQKAAEANGTKLTVEQRQAWEAALKLYKDTGTKIAIFTAERTKAAKDAREKREQEAEQARQKAAQAQKAADDKEEAQQKEHLQKIADNDKAAQKAITNSTKDEFDIRSEDIRSKYAEQLALVKKGSEEEKNLYEARGIELQQVENDRYKAQRQMDQEAAKQAAEARKEINNKQLEEAKLHSQNMLTAKLMEISGDAEAGEDPKDVIARRTQALLDAENEAFELEMQNTELTNEQREQAKLAHEQKLTQIQKDASEARKKIDENEKEAKRVVLNTISGFLANFSELVGQNTAVGKAAAIASTTISTYQAAQDAYAGVLKTIPAPAGIPIAITAAASAVVAGLARVKAIAAVKTPGTSATNVTGMAGGTAPGATPVYAAPVINTTVLNPTDPQDLNSLNGTNNTIPPIRAYITNQDLQKNDKTNNLNEQLSSY